MNKIFEKPERFDLICIFAFFVFLSISIYLFLSVQIVFAILSSIFALWALAILLGRIIAGPAYLEGHIVRVLIKNGNKMNESDLRKYYARYGSINFEIARLKERCVINIEDGIIQLVEDEVSKGFKNKLMMWGTRRVKI